MTQQEILDYNKRCAEFLGAEHYVPKSWYYFPKHCEHYYFKNRFEPNRFTLKMMKFHSHWDWIMEVIEAIEKKGYFVMINKWTCVYTGHDKEGLRIQVTTVEGNNKKTNTIQAINQFLIWHEQNIEKQSTP